MGMYFHCPGLDHAPGKALPNHAHKHLTGSILQIQSLPGQLCSAPTMGCPHGLFSRAPL